MKSPAGPFSWQRALAPAVLSLLTGTLSAAEPFGGGAVAAGPKSALDAVVTVVPVGPTQAEFDGLKSSLPKHPKVAALLAGTRYRHIESLILEVDAKDDAPPTPPRFRVTFYDYTNQRAVTAEGAFSAPDRLLVVARSDWQPIPTQEEFDEAVASLLSDKLVGAGLARGDVTPYWPMPPVLETDPQTGKPATRRVVNVGLMPKLGLDRFQNEVVGVDMGSYEVVRYDRNAPPTSKAANNPNCGVPNAGQATTTRNTAGQYQLTISSGGNVVWDMLIIRPSASSGTRASAIEVRNVKFQGASVLKRGHVPILNVKYVNDACGPYRDWQYQEGMFQTGGGTDVAPGIRDCGTTVATTALENGTDTGDFRGVAIYRQGTEVVLVTELEAGWYRYICEWRFDMNGSIRPRFGFGATTNSCTCLTHVHHVYFRLDLDVGPSINAIYEYPEGNPGAISRVSRLTTEKKITRDANQRMNYLVRGRKRGYVLVPGLKDGVADTFARGDMWILKYKTSGTTTTELDDGVNITTGAGAEANLDQFVNGESIVDQDIVIWYHATVTHSPTINSLMCTPTGFGIPGRNILTGDNVVGPDLIPEQQ